MKLVEFKPVTAAQRNTVRIKNNQLNKKKSLLKIKLKGLTKKGGRNNTGKITVRHKGGGCKRNYRKINFFRNDSGQALVLSIEYDPNRNCNIAALYDFKKKSFYYIIAPEGLKIGHVVESGRTAKAKIGSSMPLPFIPLGCKIHCVAVKYEKGSQVCRSAGTYGKLTTNKTEKRFEIILNSGVKILPKKNAYATIGVVSNKLKRFTNVGKAGRSRWLGIRPTVRGVAMNPVDHPHGGGEGKKSGKGMNLWGKPIKSGFKKN